LSQRVFPIKTPTACQLKWSWSTLYLNNGVTASCWRTAHSELTPENFNDFHNTPVKIADREAMLRGEWPEKNCGYCRTIEAEGGVSDRIRHLSDPANQVPQELIQDSGATWVEPTVIDVMFSNTCNLGCLYCQPRYSSVINNENAKHGRFHKNGVLLQSHSNTYRDLAPSFWRWFETGFQKLRRLHVLGGEPLIMKEFQDLLDMIHKYPNPECEINIVTNLMISDARLQQYIQTFRDLIQQKKILRIDISASIDCWGPQQEFVRWGLDLDQWQRNFETLLSHRWIKLNISQTITPLTIGTAADLMDRLNQWRQQRPIGHWFSDASPNPDYLKINIFGDRFLPDFERLIERMPQDTDENRLARENMRGLMLKSQSTGPDREQIKNLLIYLDEKDRRRGTNWESLYPWMVPYRALLSTGDHDVV